LGSCQPLPAWVRPDLRRPENHRLRGRMERIGKQNHNVCTGLTFVFA